MAQTRNPLSEQESNSMNKHITENLHKALRKYPITLVLETGLSPTENRQIRWVTAIAPWHWEDFTKGNRDSYDGTIHDSVESRFDDDTPIGCLGGNNDYLCSVGSEAFEVMAAIAKAFAEIGRSAEDFDTFWINPTAFLRDRGLDRSYRYNYRLFIEEI